MSSILKVDTIQNTGGTTGLTIDSGGRVLPSVPAFRADKTVAIDWTAGGGTGNLVTFNHTNGSGGSGDNSYNNGFDLSTIGTTGKVSPPVNGIYHIKASFLLNGNNSAGTAYVSINKNGTSTAGNTMGQNVYNTFATNAYWTIQANCTLSLTTSDFFGVGKNDSFKYWGSGVGVHSDYGYNFLECRLISTIQDKQMTTIATALTELGVTEWVLRGEPTSEEEFTEMYRKVTGSDDNGSAIESSNPSDFGTTWAAVSAKKTELTNAEPMRLLREERNRRLVETDWWASSDLTMSSERTTYRQALRDITNSATSLDDVTWPTKPS